MSRALLARVGRMEREAGDDNDLKWFSWPDEAHADERDAMAKEIRECKSSIWLFLSYDDEHTLPGDLQEFIDI